MSQYCNSKVLENNWFNWLLSSATPTLEEFRKAGVLWTKIIDIVRDKEGKPVINSGKSYPNPRHPIRQHCLALATPFYFTTDHGEITSHDILSGITDPFGHILNELILTSDSWVHCLDTAPLFQQYELIPKLRQEGYLKETENKISWHNMLTDIEKMCQGLSRKFNLSDDERTDLAHDAIMQVINKLVAQKLVYTPGLAPVFSLLTTTIFRCMCSTMNKSNRYKQNNYKLAVGLQSGTLPDSMRSLRVSTTKDNKKKVLLDHTT